MAHAGFRLTGLRDLTRSHLGDVHADLFDDPRVDGLLLQAYQELANEVDEAPYEWNMGPPQVLVYAVGEYEKAMEGPVRKILRVVQLDGGLDSENHPGPTTRRIRKDIVSFTSSPDYSNAVYVYRQHTTDRSGDRDPPSSAEHDWQITDHWIVGLTNANHAVVIVLLVHFATQAAVEGHGGIDLANHIPADYHYLIAVRAALLGQGAEKRDTTELEKTYLRGLHALREHLSSLHSPTQSKRF